MSNEFLFVEKYRPSNIDDIVLPERMKSTFKKIVDGGKMPNMLFSGSAGVGKTTVAKALCNTMGCDYIIINGSEEGNIDTLRTKIKQFASTISFGGDAKVVILDEADYLNAQSTQPALRGFIEEFSDNCRFILTCNFKNRIIEPLHSRCSVYDFSITKEDRPKLAAEFFQRACRILDQENITYDRVTVAKLIEKYFPDFRRVLNELQRYGMIGNIDAGILVNASEQSIAKLVSFCKAKDFSGMRKWVADNIDVEPHVIYRQLYDNASELVQPNSIPQMVITLAEYQYKNSFVADHELNTVACMTELMAQLQWK